MTLLVTQLVGFGGFTEEASGPYTANAVDFDGSNDYLNKASELTGAADSSQGIFSCWVRLDGGDSSEMYLIANASLFFYVSRSSGNTFRVDCWSQSSGRTLRFDTSSTYTSSATWLHVLASWDTNFTSGNKLHHLYINDVSDKVVGNDSASALNIDYTRGAWGVGGGTTGSQKFNGCMADLYLNIGAYMDFSVEANRRKFISAAGKPVNLGSTGSTPTGSQPIVYLKGTAATFGTNSGSGGNFTINGTLDTASSSPSD